MEDLEEHHDMACQMSHPAYVRLLWLKRAQPTLRWQVLLYRFGLRLLRLGHSSSCLELMASPSASPRQNLWSPTAQLLARGMLGSMFCPS